MLEIKKKQRDLVYKTLPSSEVWVKQLFTRAVEGKTTLFDCKFDRAGFIKDFVKLSDCDRKYNHLKSKPSDVIADAFDEYGIKLVGLLTDKILENVFGWRTDKTGADYSMGITATIKRPEDITAQLTFNILLELLGWHFTEFQVSFTFTKHQGPGWDEYVEDVNSHLAEVFTNDRKLVATDPENQATLDLLVEAFRQVSKDEGLPFQMTVAGTELSPTLLLGAYRANEHGMFYTKISVHIPPEMAEFYSDAAAENVVAFKKD